jgi:hypothetical protein
MMLAPSPLQVSSRSCVEPVLLVGLKELSLLMLQLREVAAEARDTLLQVKGGLRGWGESDYERKGGGVGGGWGGGSRVGGGVGLGRGGITGRGLLVLPLFGVCGLRSRRGGLGWV